MPDAGPGISQRRHTASGSRATLPEPERTGRFSPPTTYPFVVVFYHPSTAELAEIGQ